MAHSVVRALRSLADGPASAWRLIGDLYSSGIPAKLEWKDGTVSGSPDALRDLDELVAAGDPIAVTPTGPYVDPNRHDETSVYVMAGHILRDADLTGTPPPLDLPQLPDGAVA